MKYFNAIDNTDFMVVNNLKVFKGYLFSASLMRSVEGLSGAVSEYQVLNTDYLLECLVMAK
ncbi:hypothetical protein GCM10022277_26780 [Litoribacillus peritrichatus]|uniref:Uncharacterized protein n=1 Tax=Litoribacillus peritrichatus TaxID=718191 RepID=A0ABP7MUB9_9GAMM